MNIFVMNIFKNCTNTFMIIYYEYILIFSSIYTNIFFQSFETNFETSKAP